MYHLIGIGHDCSPAAALKALNLRLQAYPFDWVQTNLHGLERCLKDKFTLFHENLTRMDNGRRLMDAYGFQYPHDYPLVGHNETEDMNIGKGIFTEDLHRPIVDQWLLYYPTVKAKYDRRIQRFLSMIADPTPIIFLSRYPEADARRLLSFLRDLYGRTDLFIVNSCADASSDQDASSGLVSVWTEKHGIWNQSECWEEGIQLLVYYNITQSIRLRV